MKEALNIMFGSKKIQELEAKVQELQEKLTREATEKADLTQQLESANRRIAEVEAELNDFDLARLKEEAKASRAEYEGLKDLYVRKNQEFDDFKEVEEETFARDQAMQRHNLENEIRDNRQANQDYVTSTVKTFGESYNYYLNQIKLLMDALGDVATRTGEALFSGENADLKARFGSQMRNVLKSGVDSLKDSAGDDVVLIGSLDEPEPEPEEPPVEEPAEEPIEEPAEEAAEEAADAVEEVAEEPAEVAEEPAAEVEEA